MMPANANADEIEPNGGIVAAAVAAGAGCAVLGLLTVLCAASPAFADLLNLYTPSGPLTGKATVSSIIYVVVWVNLHFRLRDRELSISRGFLLTMALLGLGLLGTFPPFYQLFDRAG
jgi:branched-subunit amino acid transport protein AzlD